GTNPDGRIGQHVKVRVTGSLPVVPLAPGIDGWCEVDAFFDGATREPVDFWVHCSHKAFPSYELYVGGVPATTHSAFSHSPGDLASPWFAIDTRARYSKKGQDWIKVE